MRTKTCASRIEHQQSYYNLSSVCSGESQGGNPLGKALAVIMQYRSTHYSYLYSCLTHTQCEALNVRPRFFVFGDTFLTTNNFRFLIEYPFKSNISIAVIILMSDSYPVLSA